MNDRTHTDAGKYFLKIFTNISILLILTLFFFSNHTYSQTANNISGSDTAIVRKKVELIGEYLAPTRYSNQIKTTSFHAFFWRKKYTKISVNLNAGFTMSYAWGHVRDYITTDSGTLETSHRSAAFGFGPAVKVDHLLLDTKRFFISAEASAGIILYQKPFPYGGATYNFMVRTGPSLGLKLPSGNLLKIGYRWMHVSNGKGLGPQNPYYEVQGLSVAFTFVN